MPNSAMNVGTAVTGSAGGTQASASNGRQQAPAAVVPFVRASHEYYAAPFYTVSQLLGAGSVDLGSIDIPAYGYLRSLLVKVSATGAVAGTLSDDAPFSLLQNIYVNEPNGATIYQATSGFNTYLENKYGGYRYAGDPTADPYFSKDTAGNFTFYLRIPLEINNRDALGALPNQNAAASYKLRMSLASTAEGNTNLYTSAPTTAPTVTVNVYAESWDQPEVSTNGQSNQTTPPAMNTTQFWSEQVFAITAGQQTLRQSRVGNYFRNLIYILRDADGARIGTEAGFPNPATLFWDTRPFFQADAQLWQRYMFERTGYGYAAGATAGTTPLVPSAAPTANRLDAGVYVFDMTHEFTGKLGFENRDLWVPTLSSTRWEVQGNFPTGTPAPASWMVLTNDVSTAGNVFL